MMINFLYHYQIPFVLVATKADKLPKTKIKPRLKEISASLRVGIGDVTASSAESRLGKEEILSMIEKAITLEEIGDLDE
jgi:GTP-binding protein